MIDDKLRADLTRRLLSEPEDDVPTDKRAARIALLKANAMFDQMYALHMEEDTEEIAALRFETTGERRNYGEERRELIRFADMFDDQLEQYFKGR